MKNQCMNNDRKTNLAKQGWKMKREKMKNKQMNKQWEDE